MRAFINVSTVFRLYVREGVSDHIHWTLYSVADYLRGRLKLCVTIT